MSTWHYMKNGAQTGPVSTEELKSLLASGAVKTDALAWREGLPGWVAINTLGEFAGAAPVVPPAPPAALASGGPGVITPEAEDVEKNKVFAVLSYLPPFLFIVALIAARPSKFAMYHCNQGIVLTLAAIALSVINMVLGMVLVFIPFLGWFLMTVLNLGCFLGTVAFAVMGIINAANGACKPLPYIGNRFTIVK